MRSLQKQTGVTMIELLIVLIIAGILAAIAVPSFSDFINSTRLTSTMAQLTSDLNRARSEAIKRNSWVLVCVRSTNAACGTGTNWQNGWLVCHDSQPDGTCDTTTAANPNPIVVHQSVHPNFTLTGSAASIRFNPSGTQGTVGAATLTLENTSNASQSSTATIAATGHISRQ